MEKINKTILSMLLSGVLTVLAVMSAKADVKITNQSINGAFAISTSQNATPVYISPSEAVVVKKIANMFAEDVKQVTGHKPTLIFNKKVNSKKAIIIGTLGSNTFIDNLVKRGKLNTKDIHGGWEQYLIQIIKNPSKGIE